MKQKIKRKFVYLLIMILVLVSVNPVYGQTVSKSVSGELERLFIRLTKNLSDSIKIQVNDSISTFVESYVQSDTVFNHKFNNLRYLGQVTSPDSLLKIISWNLVLVRKPGKYYSYIIKRQNQGKSNLVYRLTTDYNDYRIRTDTTYSSADWYGALYYDIRPQTIAERKSWVLLGIDYGNPVITRKIIDILDFNMDDNIMFGMKVFSADDTLSYREVFEYSSSATMTLRFDSDGSIFFDHLVPFSPEQTNDRQYYAPHYSNDAYIHENGLWRFKLNVDARNIE